MGEFAAPVTIQTQCAYPTAAGLPLPCSGLYLRLMETRIDIVDKSKRSAMMAGIRSKDTRPEMQVRRVAHALGYRFRLHRKDLPGSPDLVFPRLGKVIMVHGCYWHRHPGCRFAYQPKSNTSFWQRKFEKNQERDQRALSELRNQGWDTLVIWECETRDLEGLRVRIASYLGHGGGHESQN